jgi:SAM-dependent MidA family methyltransferase
MAPHEPLSALIAREGPLRVDAFMRLCLHHPDHGYYARRPGLGAEGDFITAPMVSQIFGEALGLWAAQVWLNLGRPPAFTLVELGPGAGCMMADALRAARQVAPEFLGAAHLWLVETSGPLRARQAAALPAAPRPRWTDSLEAVPSIGPLVLLANEFLDCLPIRQAVRAVDGWRERWVRADSDGVLSFAAGEPVSPPCTPTGAPTGAVVEWSDAVASFGRMVGARVAHTGGAALFIDYGRAGVDWGDSLQALRRHRKESPLAHPGHADVTAHVDFAAFRDAAARGGACVTPIRGQGSFLEALGAPARAEVLRRAHPDRAAVIERQLHRLMGSDQMGTLFKAMALHAPGLVVPGFETEP